MILLKHLLQEISLAGVQPYTTTFDWKDRWNDQEQYEAEFDADGQPVKLQMMWFKNSRVGDSGVWAFGFFVHMRTAGQPSETAYWTTAAKSSAAAGEVNTLRFFKTIGLAIRDFADTHPGVDVIDITGGDSSTSKEQQKSRIYARFLQTNPDLSDFRVDYGSTKLWLVRKPGQSRPDASGIDTPNNPDM